MRDFDAVIEALTRRRLRPALVQALASPGLFVAMRDAADAVAIGHLLYGLRPVADSLRSMPDAGGFRAALTAVRTRLLHVGERPPRDQAAAYLQRRPAASASSRWASIIPTGRPLRKLSSSSAAPGRRVLRPCLENAVVDLSAVAGRIARRRGVDPWRSGRTAHRA